VSLTAQAEPPYVLKLAELNTEQIRALDKAKTIVMIPGGILHHRAIDNAGEYFRDTFGGPWT
jgi:hypothetical protein